MIREHNVIESAPEGGAPVTLAGPVYKIDIRPPLPNDTEGIVTARLKWPEPNGYTAVVFIFDSRSGGGWACAGSDMSIQGPLELSLSGGRGKFDFITNRLL